MGKSSPLNILSQKKGRFWDQCSRACWLWDSLPKVRNRKKTESESGPDQCHTGRWQGMRSRSVPLVARPVYRPCFFTSFLSQTIWAVWVREEMQIKRPATHWPDDKGHRHMWCNPAKRPSALLDLLLPHYRAPSYVLLTRASYLHPQYL